MRLLVQALLPVVAANAAPLRSPRGTLGLLSLCRGDKVIHQAINVTVITIAVRKIFHACSTCSNSTPRNRTGFNATDQTSKGRTPLTFLQASTGHIVLPLNRLYSNLRVGTPINPCAVDLQLIGGLMIHCLSLHPTGLEVGAMLIPLYHLLIKVDALEVLEPSHLISGT